MIALSPYRLRVLLAALLLAPAVWYIVPEESKQRLRETGTDITSIQRKNYRERGLEIAKQYPVLGIGYANWFKVYTSMYRDPTAHEPHNIFIQAVAELGFPGLAAFLFLIGATFWVNWQTRRLLARAPPANKFLTYMAYAFDAALFSYLATGFFVTVLYYPFFWINLAMTCALYRVAVAETQRRLAFGMAAPQFATVPAGRPRRGPGFGRRPVRGSLRRAP